MTVIIQQLFAEVPDGFNSRSRRRRRRERAVRRRENLWDQGKDEVNIAEFNIYRDEVEVNIRQYSGE